MDIYLPRSKYEGRLDDENDPADDEGKVEDLKEATSLFEEEAGEEGDKHLMKFISLSVENSLVLLVPLCNFIYFSVFVAIRM